MTRRSYPKVSHGPIVACPCCRRELEAFVHWEQIYDDADDEAHVTLTPVPLREQPCGVFVHRYECDPKLTAPGGFVVGWKHNVWPSCNPFRRGYRPGAACNWLGPTCNDASHVTQCEVPLLRWFDCPDWKNMVRRDCCAHLRPGVSMARCVHLPEA